MHDQRDLADARIGLAQTDALELGEPHQLFARPMLQLGVGREHHRLLLHAIASLNIDNDLGEVGRLGAGGDAQAFLNQRGKLLLAHALAPAGDRRAVERQIMAEELLAAEQLIIGVLDPNLAQPLIRQIERVLENGEPRHQPGWQGRMAGAVLVDGAKRLFQKTPVNLARQLGQRVLYLDDLVQPRGKGHSARCSHALSAS
jgi:hypothetical protein